MGDTTRMSFTADQLHALSEGASYALAVAEYQDPETIGLTDEEYKDFRRVLERIERRLETMQQERR